MNNNDCKTFEERQSGLKAVSQVDFIIAVGIFLIAIMFVINYMTDFIVPLKELSESENQQQRAMNIMDSVKRENSLLDLYTKVYTTKIKLENTRQFLINTSHPIVDLWQEAVKLNLSSINFTSIDRFSVVIYNDSGRRNEIEYHINGDVIIFNASIRADRARFFYVYFDDDSNFSDSTVRKNITNELNEIVYPVQQLYVIQHRKIADLSAKNYSMLREIAGGDFRIEIVNEVTGEKIFIGPEQPSRGDVVAMESAVLLQRENRLIHNAVLKVYVW